MNEISELHQQRLKQMCGLPPDKALPKQVSDIYWQYKIVMDRISSGLTDSELAAMAVAAGFGKPTKREANPTVVDLYRTKKITAGQPLTCQHGDKQKTGKLARVTYANQVGVIFDGDNEETLLNADKVALAAT